MSPPMSSQQLPLGAIRKTLEFGETIPISDEQHKGQTFKLTLCMSLFKIFVSYTICSIALLTRLAVTSENPTSPAGIPRYTVKARKPAEPSIIAARELILHLSHMLHSLWAAVACAESESSLSNFLPNSSGVRLCARITAKPVKLSETSVKMGD